MCREASVIGMLAGRSILLVMIISVMKTDRDDDDDNYDIKNTRDVKMI